MKILPDISFYNKVSDASPKYRFTANFYGKNLLTKPIIDTCSFTRSDKTLEQKFLKELLKLDNENISTIQKYTKIKDKMLRAMGYKHPEDLKLVYSGNNASASYEVTQGTINVSEKEMNMPTTQFIATLRHELEHFDQFVKIYKTMGENDFHNALKMFVKRYKPELNLSEISVNFNKHFYEIMSKDADTKNFDAKEHYKAMCEYTPFDYALSKGYKYYNNLLEKEAYSAERKILSSLGEDPAVSADAFPHNYQTLIKLLDDNKVPLQYQDNVLLVLRLAAQIKSLETPENFKKIWKIWSNEQNNIENTPKETKILEKSLNKVNKIYVGSRVTSKQVELDKKCYEQMEAWLRKGIYYFEDISCNL